MQAVPPNYLPWLVIAVPLVVWRVYSRIKRNIGRQPLSKWRPWFTMTLFPLLVILISMGAVSQPLKLLAMVGGIAAGAVLGVFGTRHTKFENTPQGIFYTPNAHIGIALSVIFLGRLAYRMFQIYPDGHTNPADLSTPLTLSIFGLLAGYYVTYAIGLVRYKASVERAAAPESAPSAES
jgi:hypothetical protein